VLGLCRESCTDRKNKKPVYVGNKTDKGNNPEEEKKWKKQSPEGTKGEKEEQTEQGDTRRG
jgi:hypothetical protein